MRIGSHALRNNLFVAPMAGVTDRPFRQLCKNFGAGLAVSEMVASNSLLWGSEKTLRRANHDGEVEPISVQIAGADPAMMAEAARYNVEQGAQIVDNAGVRLLSLHGRTRACGFSGRADYDTIREVKRSTRLPVVANGDISTPEEAKQV